MEVKQEGLILHVGTTSYLRLRLGWHSWFEFDRLRFVSVLRHALIVISFPMQMPGCTLILFLPGLRRQAVHEVPGCLVTVREH
jgi:hypothetical protein